MDFIANSLAVIDYLRIGVFSVINNLITWMIAHAFVFSLWKFRNSSPCSVEPREDAASEERLAPSLEKSSLSVAPVLSPTTDSTVFGATKGKITVFFGEDEVDRKEGEEKDGGDDDEAVTEEVGGEWWWDWERSVLMLRVRSGETNWYSCRDLTFVNGNVVRLWDDVRTRLLTLSNGVC